MSRAWSGGSTRKWRNLRLQVLVRDNYRCQIKGPSCLTIANTADHIIPRAEGGLDVIENLRASCAPCNFGRPVARRVAGDPAPLANW